MRGHQPLLHARRAGGAPESVWLHDTPPGAQLLRQRFPWPMDGKNAEVDIEPSDSPRRLDLRFVVGLCVHVHAWTPDRLKAITERAVECGAKRVLGALFRWRGDAPECIEMTDTEGVVKWRA